jgi:uncharacterized protein YlxP (DUF503 family)
MSVGLLTLHLHLPGCTSLKEKRSRLKPLLARLQREFNVSVAEMGRQDAWRETVIACAMVSSDANQTHRALQDVARWVESSWPDLELTDHQLELL